MCSAESDRMSEGGHTIEWKVQKSRTKEMKVEGMVWYPKDRRRARVCGMVRAGAAGQKNEGQVSVEVE